MARKTWIKLKRGLLAPKHREAIGIRVWLYLFILDRANWEEGAVLTWRDQDASEELEMPIDTVRQQRRQLEVAGYIRTEHQGDHLRLVVCKWVNPREYSGQVYNPPSVAVPEEGESLQNPPLLENEGGDKGGNKSGHESGYKSGELSPPLKGITDHSPQITESGASSAPSRDQTLWVQVLAGLRLSLSRADYDTWVRNSEVRSQRAENGRLLLDIVVGNEYAAHHLIEMGIDEKAAAIASEIAKKPVHVQIGCR